MGVKEERKFQNLYKLVELLLDHPEGLTRSEIARRLGVHRSTAGEYVDNMDAISVPVVEVSPNRFTVHRDDYQVTLSLNLHEALSVHLAARLLATRTDKHDPHAAAALRKLGRALEKLAPLMSVHIRQSADVLDGEDRRSDPVFTQVLEELTRAWSRGVKLRLTHEMEDGRVFEYTFAPYFIEPYAVGRTVHVIGLREPPGKLRTFKIERIRTAKMLPDQPYTIPADFDPRALLRDAWGIWFDEGEPEEVRLRFSRAVARRVRETVWHHTQALEEQEDGGLVWTARVAAWREMLPWVRGWGADVEVLGPEGMRDMLKRETHMLTQLYNLNASPIAQATMANCLFFGHSKDGHDKSEWQCLRDHLVNTANLAAEFGRDAGVSELGWVAGLMHDIGKYSEAFQRRLEGSKRKVDHSTAGAKEITALFGDQPQKTFAEILAYCIAGHHTGLPDYGSQADVEGDGTLLARLRSSKLEDYTAYKNEIDTADLKFSERLSIKPIKNYKGKSIPGFSVSFLTRMVYSALVDADYQETETYMRGEEKPRGGYASIEELCRTFNQFLKKFDNPTGELNEKRTVTLKACVKRATEAPGFFTLTVPTGGGKTFASMGFALNHAAMHGLKRVIYVIPFTSIIEQNAAEFKECLGDENVLEHHANFDWEQKRKAGGELPDDNSSSVYAKLKLAAENWDIPIVVTTNVQFFESLFANRSSRCRKLHNIAKSVIIFDEAQMLPREYMEPCMNAVQELVQNYGASVIFCTATQPSLARFLAPKTPMTELAPNTQNLFDSFRRVQVKSKGELPDDQLLEELRSHLQVLCIVNTRKHAKGLFDGLASISGDGCFHLSTLMCPAHRKESLATIRRRLKNGEACRVVSTQVMEAGIDVDFPVGYRSIAGLDSIIQAAGRVNREGKQESGEIYVFEPVTPFIKKTPTFIRQGASVTENILRVYSADPMSVEAIDAYFNMLYTLRDERSFDTREILPCFEKGLGELSFDFRTAAERFKLIDDITVPVIIPYNQEAKELIEELRYTPYPAAVLRKLQMYTVNVYDREFENLQSKGVIETHHDKYEVLNTMISYAEKTGLILPTDEGGGALFFD